MLEPHQLQRVLGHCGTLQNLSGWKGEGGVVTSPMYVHALPYAPHNKKVLGVHIPRSHMGLEPSIGVSFSRGVRDTQWVNCSEDQAQNNGQAY